MSDENEKSLVNDPLDAQLETAPPAPTEDAPRSKGGGVWIAAMTLLSGVVVLLLLPAFQHGTPCAKRSAELERQDRARQIEEAASLENASYAPGASVVQQ